MVTGRKAFEGTSQASLLSAILKDHPPPVSSLASASPLVDRIVSRCLAKDADERFQSAHDLLIALRWAAELDGRPAGVTAPDARPIDRSGTRAWMLATAASVATAALQGALIQILHDGSQGLATAGGETSA
jgi:eukaryotic-like serine/threonine-protein kinase